MRLVELQAVLLAALVTGGTASRTTACATIYYVCLRPMPRAHCVFMQGLNNLSYHYLLATTY